MIVFIQQIFFKIPKFFILTELSFCENNEIRSKNFLKKFHRFIKDRFEVAIKWKSKQVLISKGTCSCGETCIGETIRNASIRWEEYSRPTENLEPAKHIFNWVLLCKAPHNYKVRRNLEASYIALLKPTLNEQKAFEILILFSNGIT